MNEEYLRWIDYRWDGRFLYVGRPRDHKWVQISERVKYQAIDIRVNDLSIREDHPWFNLWLVTCGDTFRNKQTIKSIGLTYRLNEEIDSIDHFAYKQFMKG